MSEVNLEIKKIGNKDKYELRTYTGNRKGSNSYFNIIDRDPVKLAQILIDIEIMESFPVEKAVKIYLKRKRNGDWLTN